jgi:hypothetical protein
MYAPTSASPVFELTHLSRASNNAFDVVYSPLEDDSNSPVIFCCRSIAPLFSIEQLLWLPCNIFYDRCFPSLMFSTQTEFVSCSPR